MTLIEKLEALTPEQQQKFDAITTEQELDAFLRETGEGLMGEKKAAAWKYIQARQVKPDVGLNGKAELADEELDNVAGGHRGLCHDKKGREIVTLITPCVHGLKEREIDQFGRPTNYYTTRLCFWPDEEAGTSNCRYLSYEKGIWYCNYNVMTY